MSPDEAQPGTGRGSLNARLLVAVLLTIVALSCGGWIAWMSTLFMRGNDSWRHYSLGGMFVTDSPSFSQDGDQIVFATPASGHGDIYLADISTGKARRLTQSNDFESSPYFVPGTQKIVFQRETVPYENVWLLDVQSGMERQLTEGDFTHTIVDVSPAGTHILVTRSSRWTGDFGILLINVATGETNEMKNIHSAQFVGDGNAVFAVQCSESKCKTIRMNLKGDVESEVSGGSVADICDPCQTALMMDGRFEPPDQSIYAVNVETNERIRIARGSRPRMFANGKVLFFVGFQCRARIWKLGMESPREIESPPGYVVTPNRSGDAMSAVLFVMPPSQPKRLYDTYLFDAQTEKFTKVNVKLPTAGEE